MNQPSTHYDLRNEAWLPIEWADGSSGFVSLRDALIEASKIRRISGEIPGEPFALLRLLIALVYCIYPVPEDMNEGDKKGLWNELWDQGALERDRIEDYFNEFPHEFDLFDDEHPFYQVPGLVYMGGKKEYDSISEFMLDVPKPDKFLFSMRDARHLDALPFDVAARYLVVAQAYDMAGIKTPVVGNTSAKSGKAYAPKGALGTGWCGTLGGVFLEGRNLFETLLLNWVLFLAHVSVTTADDCAPWERDVPPADTYQREPTGPIDLLTWQSRRMRLVPGKEGTDVIGVIISYGDILIPANKQRFEMMTGWRESKQQQKKLGTAEVPLMPAAFDTERALWRGLTSLLIVSEGKTHLRPGVVRWMEELQDEQSVDDWRLNVRIVSQGVRYGTQSSVVEDAATDSVDLSISLLRRDSDAVSKMLEVIESTDRAVGILVQFVENVERAQGDKRRYRSSSDSVAQATKKDVREGAYDALDGLYRDRIAAFPDEGVIEYCADWRSEARTVLKRLARSYVSRRHVSYFSEHEDVSIGQALIWFERRLSKELP